MVFANPVFLFGLFALAVPILIHLFNFRRYRKIYFTNVHFLSAIKQETRKRSELRQWLILISRLLAVASLVLAFAQPFIPSPLQKQKHTGQGAVSVYLDNSFSMEGMTSDGNLLETAKSKALEIAAASSPSDQFFLVTNEADVRYNLPVSREEFSEMVREVTLSPVSVPVSSIVLRQKEALGRTQAGHRSIYLLSDFQRTTADLALLPADTVDSYLLVPLHPGKTANLYVDSAWFESPVQQPDQPSVLKVSIKNTGTESFEKVPVKLTINGRQKAVSGIEIPAGSGTTVSLPFTNEAEGLQNGRVEITDNPVVFDNALYLSYPLLKSIPVLSINGSGENPFLNAFFRDDSTFRFDNVPVKQIEYSSLRRYSLLILNGLTEFPTGLQDELTQYVENGGQILIFPARTATPESYRAFMTRLSLPAYVQPDTSLRRVDKINTESRVFADVFEKNAAGKVILPENTDFPVAFFHFRLDPKGNSGGEVLMKLDNGDPFLQSFDTGKGRVYLCSSPLDPVSTSFPKHPLFVPALYRITLLSTRQQPLYYFTGSNEPIMIQGDTLSDRSVYFLKKQEGSFEIIPEMRNTGSAVMLFPREQVKEAGHYAIVKDKTLISMISFNYNRTESEPLSLSDNEISTALMKDGIRYFLIIKDNNVPVARQVKAFQEGTPLWKLFVIFTLLFIVTEIVIIRIMK